MPCTALRPMVRGGTAAGTAAAAWRGSGVPAVRLARRGYKTAISPSMQQKPPEISRQELVTLKHMHEERKMNQEEEIGMARDPTTRFLTEGRLLLSQIHDGGAVRLVMDTGVPGVFAIELENLEANQRNAMTAQMMVELEDCVREINRHPECVAVILRGTGTHFCSGGSIQLAKEHLLNAERGLVMCRYMQTLLLELHNLPCITVAAVEGGAVGGGAELATAADFRIVSEESRIHFIHTHMGLSTGWGGGTRLTKLVGRRAAILLLCSGKPCYPPDAMAFGLADKVSKEGEAYHDALQFIKANFLHAPTEAVKGCKDVIAAAEILAPRTALIYEQNVFAALWEKNARAKTAEVAHNRAQLLGQGTKELPPGQRMEDIHRPPGTAPGTPAAKQVSTDVAPDKPPPVNPHAMFGGAALRHQVPAQSLSGQGAGLDHRTRSSGAYEREKEQMAKLGMRAVTRPGAGAGVDYVPDTDAQKKLELEGFKRNPALDGRGQPTGSEAPQAPKQPLPVKESGGPGEG